jgi:hypothetical protein
MLEAHGTIGDSLPYSFCGTRIWISQTRQRQLRYGNVWFLYSLRLSLAVL